MTESVLTVVTRGVFVLAFVLTLLYFARRRDLLRLELALLFGCLAPISVLQTARELIGYLPEWLTLVAALAFLAHPFVMLLLLRHFRTISRSQILLSAI